MTQAERVSDRLRFLFAGMASTTETDEELNAAMNWLYFALVLGMVDPMGAAGIAIELENHEAWSETYKTLTRKNAKLLLDEAGKYLEGKEGFA